MSEKELKETTSTNAVAQTEQNDSLDCRYADDDDTSYDIRRLKFGAQGRGPWGDAATEEPLPADLLLLLTGYRHYRRFFGPGVVPEIILLKPNEKFDVEAMNAKVPQEEWGTNPYTGKPQGPWQGFRELLFIDEKTMTPWSYSVPIDTVGGTRAIQELRKVTRWARKFKDPNLSPRILLREKPMPTTKYGVVPRPYLEIQTDKWAALGGQIPSAGTGDGIGVEETENPDFKGDKVPY